MPVLYPVFLDAPVPGGFTNLSAAITNCSGGVQWIHNVLGECVLTDRQYASVIAGLISLAIWMTVGFPQMYKNCRKPESLEGLSLLFVAQWLLGDSTNLVGCILTKQLPLQTYTAIYYVTADLVLLGQIFYFRSKKRYRNRRKDDLMGDSLPRVVLCVSGFMSLSALLAVFGRRQNTAFDHSNLKFPTGRTLLSVEQEQYHLEGVHFFKGALDITGYIIGVVSASFYVGSRVAQIYLSWVRKTTEGLSVFMFLLAVLGNLFYGLSVFLQSTDEVFIIRHLPWIIGSLGIMAFDFSILMQHFYYKRHNNLTEELGGREPLLNGESIN